MDKELLLKDGLLYFVFAATTVGTTLVTTDSQEAGLVLWGLALFALLTRTYVKSQQA